MSATEEKAIHTQTTWNHRITYNEHSYVLCAFVFQNTTKNIWHNIYNNNINNNNNKYNILFVYVFILGIRIYVFLVYFLIMNKTAVIQIRMDLVFKIFLASRLSDSLQA